MKKVNQKIRIAVIGSRSFSNWKLVRKVLKAVHKKHGEFVLVSGGARGADQMGQQVAKEMGCECVIFKPDWDSHGKRAGFVRNHLIIGNADAVIAFWDGESKGTKHSINLAKDLNKPVWILK